MNDSRAQDFVGDLQDAIKDNPVPAALIGVGILWMFAGGHRISSAAALLGSGAGTAAGAVTGGAQTAIGAVARGAQAIGSQVASTVSGGVEAASSVATSAASAAQRAAGSAFTQAGPAVEHGADMTRHAADRTRQATARVQNNLAGVQNNLSGVQSNLRETFERQPLLLGALGVALGAGMAATFASTATEKEMIGSAAQNLKAKASDAVSDAAEKVSEIASRTLTAVQDEAVNQGLTLGHARDAGAALGQKVKTALTFGQQQPNPDFRTESL